MIPLKKLVEVQQQLNELRASVNSTIDCISNNINVVLNDLPPVLLPTLDNTIAAIVSLRSTLDSDVNMAINSIAKHINKRGGQLTVNMSSHNELANCYPMSDRTKQTISGVLSRYLSWQYPALEIGASSESIINLLQHAQPLTVANNNNDAITALVNRLPTDQAQNRIIRYITQDHNILPLPLGQHSLIFSWNFLNYCTVDVVEQYLSQCFQLLRPGGAVIFSFNNCIYPYCAELAENKIMHYATTEEITAICHRIGFVVKSTEWIEQHVTWAEIVKPGVLSTMKVHPVIGTIKNTFE